MQMLRRANIHDKQSTIHDPRSTSLSPDIKSEKGKDKKCEKGKDPGVVQAHRTSSNLLEPHHYRDSKVFRVLSVWNTYLQIILLQMPVVFSICKKQMKTGKGFMKHTQRKGSEACIDAIPVRWHLSCSCSFILFFQEEPTPLPHR